MRHLLNTLYVLTPHSELYCRNQTICVSVGGTEKVAIPAISIDSIICFGTMSITTPLVDFCGKAGISITLLSDYGRFCGRFYGPMTGSIYLRHKQHMLWEDMDFRLAVGRNIVGAKLKNTAGVMMREERESKQPNNLSDGIAIVNAQRSLAKSAISLDELRGYEGVAASAYFQRFGDLLCSDIPFSFENRYRRPPKDVVNAALSFAYSLLTKEYVSALECFGIDPGLGIIHGLRAGRPALALDLMEELRAPLCDRFVLSLFNRKQLQANHFDERTDSTLLNEKGRKIFLSAWQLRKEDLIIHHFIKERIKIGLIPFIQAQLFGRVIRGELDAYPPFLWR